MRRKLARRTASKILGAVSYAAYLFKLRGMISREEVELKLWLERKKRGELDRAQWRRWYKANRKRQRQLTAYKRLGGGKIDPRITGLPRAFVP